MSSLVTLPTPCATPTWPPIFFLLSGYVVGYAYADRWPALTVRDFFRLRLIRLHPIVLRGVLCYCLDPYVPTVSPRYLLVVIALGMLLLPAPALPTRYGKNHALNGLCWSLLQQYLANIVYALAAPRLGRRGPSGTATCTAAGPSARFEWRPCG